MYFSDAVADADVDADAAVPVPQEYWLDGYGLVVWLDGCFEHTSTIVFFLTLLPMLFLSLRSTGWWLVGWLV